MHYLGHIIDERGNHKSEDLIRGLRKLEVRKTHINELRTFLGLVSCYNRCIKDVFTLCHPYINYCKKTNQFIWSSRCEQSVLTVQKIMSSDTVLCHLERDVPRVLAGYICILQCESWCHDFSQISRWKITIYRVFFKVTNKGRKALNHD